MGSKFLIENSGVLTEFAAYKLMETAYSVPNVAKVQVTYDADISNDGKSPIVSYSVELEPKFRKRYYTKEESRAKRSLISKLLFLYRAKRAEIPPGAIENVIQTSASAYLPDNVKVVVNVK